MPWLKEYLLNQLGSTLNLTNKQVEFIYASFLIVIAVILYYSIKYTLNKIFSVALKKLGKKFPIFHEIHANNKNFISHLINLISFIIFTKYVIFILHNAGISIDFINKCVSIIYAVISLILILDAITLVFNHLKKKPALQKQPLDSYKEILKIISFCCVLGYIYVIITDTSIYKLFATIGAISAVLLLVFKDLLLGLIASFQITNNHIANINDWIVFQKYGADGNIIAISLSTVTVRNWDNTYTTIPTTAFINDSFQNYKGMSNSGIRRIKKHVSFSYNSIKNLTVQDLEKLSKLKLISSFVKNYQDKYQELSSLDDITDNDNFSALCLNENLPTNLEIFVYYIEQYLKNSQKIFYEYAGPFNRDFLIRQLQPTEYGIPLEIYCFAKNNKWIEYESIQDSIFNHVFIAAKYFDLEMYQLNVKR